mgnify:CR=1 FL=1
MENGAIVAGGQAIILAPLVVGALKWLGARYAPEFLAWVKADPKRQEAASRAISFLVGALWAYLTKNPAETAAVVGGASAVLGPVARDFLHRLILRK